MSQRDLHNVVHAQILVVDDEAEHADTMAEALRRLGHVCTIVTSAAAAEEELTYGNFDVIITDLSMETEDAGLRVLSLAREHQPDAESLMVTAHGDVATAKAALQGGAYDFIEKPLDLDVFRNLVQRAVETVRLRDSNTRLQSQVEAAWGFEGIIGDSPAIRKVIATIRQVSPSNIPVLITGESGTGKELAARALHDAVRIYVRHVEIQRELDEVGRRGADPVDRLAATRPAAVLVAHAQVGQPPLAVPAAGAGGHAHHLVGVLFTGVRRPRPAQPAALRARRRRVSRRAAFRASSGRSS